jgi:hypothetical protein
MNFVKSEDAPMVFHTLENDTLVYAGTFTTKFDPSQIIVSKSTGRIYHSLRTKAVWKGLEIGLIKSSVVLDQLYDGLDMDSDTFTWKEKQYRFNWID